MRFIALQTNPVWHDVAENRRRIEGALDASGFHSGDYVVLPEMCETAWTTDTSALERAHDSVAWFSSVARARAIWVQAGFPEQRSGGRFSNSAAVIGPDGRLRATYRKNFLFPSERSSFEAGDGLSIIDVGTAKVCPLVCYDLRFPELFRLAALAGAEVFTVGACWPAPRAAHRRALAVARAIENQAFVVACNRIGRDPNADHAGDSFVVAPSGEVIAEAGDAERVLEATLDRRTLLEWRDRFPALRDLRRSLLGNVRIA